MRSCGIAAVVSLLFCLGVSTWAIDGTFQGKVVDPPSTQLHLRGWIYIQGRNHMLRRVDVSHAAVVFSENIPPSQRHKCGAECLTPGQEVLITAEQDGAGEWVAKRVEILKVTTSRV